MASFIANTYKQKLFDNTTKIAVTDTWKLALTTSSYTPNQDSHDFFDDVTNEISGSGYTAGGATVANVTLTLDTANDRVVIDADDVTWSNSTIQGARYGILYKSTGVAGTSPLIAIIDFGSDRNSSLTNFVVQWNAAGIIRLT